MSLTTYGRKDYWLTKVSRFFLTHFVLEYSMKQYICKKLKKEIY